VEILAPALSGFSNHSQHLHVMLLIHTNTNTTIDIPYYALENMAMASSNRPIAFMLRCRQASLVSAKPSWQSLVQNLQLVKQTLRAVSTASASTPPPLSPPTKTLQSPFPSSRRTSTPRPDPLPHGAYSPTINRPTQFRTERPLSIWTAIKTVFGWKPATSSYVPAPFSAINNPYRARKIWPPDFTTLHPKHQFHFEKTYRRRSKLKYTRPGWIRGTKVVQFALSLFVLGYWIFYLDVDGKGSTPFHDVSEQGLGY
jgi:hypothetical protein